MIYTTGNDRVDAVGRIDFSGNMTPPMWFHTIRNEKKPEFAAIAILSDIVYWYRPQEIRDEGSGQVVAFKKKFRGDLLQRSYQQIADQFGISKRQATDAINFLQKIGAIRKEFRTINAGGVVLNNVLFIDINPERVDELTHPKKEIPEGGSPMENVTPVTENRERVSPKNVTGATPEGDTLPPKNVIGVTSDCERVSPEIGTGVTEKRETNTKTSPETTQETSTESSTESSTSVHPSLIRVTAMHAQEADGLTEAEKKQIYREQTERLVKHQLRYYDNIRHMPFDEKALFEQTVDLIIDTICDEGDVVEIGQSRMPREVVKSRFLKLTDNDVKNVIDKVTTQSGSEIKNMHKYMLTALYRETLTGHASVSQWVNHKLFGEEEDDETGNEGNTSGSTDQYMDFIKRLSEQNSSRI